MMKGVKCMLGYTCTHYYCHRKFLLFLVSFVRGSALVHLSADFMYKGEKKLSARKRTNCQKKIETRELLS